MGKDKDLSVFIKCTLLFFLCCLFPFKSIREKNGKIKHVKISHSTVCACSSMNIFRSVA